VAVDDSSVSLIIINETEFSYPMRRRGLLIIHDNMWIYPTTDMSNCDISLGINKVSNKHLVDDRGNHDGTQVFVFMVQSPSALNMFPAMLRG